MRSIKTKMWISFVVLFAAFNFFSSYPNIVNAEIDSPPSAGRLGMQPLNFLQSHTDPLTVSPPSNRTGDLSVIGHWPTGPCYAVASNGTDRLYVGNGRRLDVYDITTGSSPDLGWGRGRRLSPQPGGKGQ